jgi:hypothetical protein
MCPAALHGDGQRCADLLHAVLRCGLLCCAGWDGHLTTQLRLALVCFAALRCAVLRLSGARSQLRCAVCHDAPRCVPCGALQCCGMLCAMLCSALCAVSWTVLWYVLCHGLCSAMCAVHHRSCSRAVPMLCALHTVLWHDAACSPAELPLASRQYSVLPNLCWTHPRRCCTPCPPRPELPRLFQRCRWRQGNVPSVCCLWLHMTLLSMQDRLLPPARC